MRFQYLGKLEMAGQLTLRSGHPFGAIGVIFLQIPKALQHDTRPHGQCVFGEVSDAPI